MFVYAAWFTSYYTSTILLFSLLYITLLYMYYTYTTGTIIKNDANDHIWNYVKHNRTALPNTKFDIGGKRGHNYDLNVYVYTYTCMRHTSNLLYHFCFVTYCVVLYTHTVVVYSYMHANIHIYIYILILYTHIGMLEGGKQILMAEKAVLHLILNQERTYIEKWVHYKKRADVCVKIPIAPTNTA